MIHIRPGSQAWQLITLLSFVGEFPVCSLHLLGNERVLKALVHKLTEVQTFRNYHTETEMTCRLLNISGKSKNKTIRFYKAALPILDWIHPNAYEYYMHSFWNHRFPGDVAHRERNHRVAESAAICMRAGFEVRPYLLPKLQNTQLLSVIPREPVMYLAKDLKRVGETEMNKTMFTRVAGAVFNSDNCYAVYNTRNATMKWNGMGEFKTLHSLLEVSRLNSGINSLDSAILFGQSGDTALNTLIESDKNRRLEFRFDSIYNHIHFFPLNIYGIEQLRLLSVSNWKEQILDLLFEPSTRSYNRGLFEYDAQINGIYVLSHLDGDIARLIRFRNAIDSMNAKFEILCFPHQTRFIREYIRGLADIKTIDIKTISSELIPKEKE